MMTLEQTCTRFIVAYEDVYLKGHPRSYGKADWMDILTRIITLYIARLRWLVDEGELSREAYDDLTKLTTVGQNTSYMDAADAEDWTKFLTVMDATHAPGWGFTGDDVGVNDLRYRGAEFHLHHFAIGEIAENLCRNAIAMYNNTAVPACGHSFFEGLK